MECQYQFHMNNELRESYLGEKKLPESSSFGHTTFLMCSAYVVKCVFYMFIYYFSWSRNLRKVIMFKEVK